MPSYTSSITQGDGYVIVAVLDTETNLITYTVTSPQGISATASASPDASPPAAKLIEQLRAAGQRGGIQITSSLQSVKEEVKLQASTAATASAENGTPVPDNPSPPPPQENPVPTPPTPPPEDPGVVNPPPVDSPGPATPPEGEGPTVTGPNPVDNPDTEGYGDASQRGIPVYAEDGTFSGFYTNPETGELYDPFQRGEPLSEPEPVDNPDTEGYGDASQRGIPVYGEDGTFSGFYKNPETGELYDPFQRAENTDPASSAAPGYQGLVGDTEQARASTDVADQSQANNLGDWRVRLSLASEANYLYKANPPGILAPLAATNGVIFPYTPGVQMNYTATYDSYSPVHNNYKYHTYTSSAVDTISITADFTAQDTYEANYLLAVIHFFKSLTKMFYGQDQNPKNGTPPPLVFLNGMGAFQFNNHPLLVQNFSYNLPNDVDYIRANVAETSTVQSSASANRLGNQIEPGGTVKRAVVNPSQSTTPTYVPTKIQLQISALPVVTRNQISNIFSLKDYATGKLLKGNQNATGGIW